MAKEEQQILKAVGDEWKGRYLCLKCFYQRTITRVNLNNTKIVVHNNILLH